MLKPQIVCARLDKHACDLFASTREATVWSKLTVSKLQQINIKPYQPKAPGHSTRKPLRYSKQTILLACKGRQRGLLLPHSWQEHQTECPGSWPCHRKAILDKFSRFNIHLFNKYLMSVCKIPVLTEFRF